MTEYEKMRAGFLHWGLDEEIGRGIARARDLCFDYNMTRPSDTERTQKILRELLQSETDAFVVAPFMCDYGYNIHLGKRCYINAHCFFLDEVDITLGDDVLVGPYCCICTCSHAFDRQQRVKRCGCCTPISIGNAVWLGVGVKVMPGVTIGDNVIIGAGSVVTRDIPSNTLAFGTPCRVVRELNETDKRHFPILPEDENHPLFYLHE